MGCENLSPVIIEFSLTGTHFPKAVLGNNASGKHEILFPGCTDKNHTHVKTKINRFMMSSDHPIVDGIVSRKVHYRPFYDSPM